MEKQNTPLEETKIICPYCNAPYTFEMLETLDLCDGSYTTDCCSSKISGNIDIICKNCKKLVYRKEIRKNTETVDYYDELRWKRQE